MQRARCTHVGTEETADETAIQWGPIDMVPIDTAVNDINTWRCHARHSLFMPTHVEKNQLEQIIH